MVCRLSVAAFIQIAGLVSSYQAAGGLLLTQLCFQAVDPPNTQSSTLRVVATIPLALLSLPPAEGPRRQRQNVTLLQVSWNFLTTVIYL